ncbi:MAG: hypothetical protein AVDCRST_MAG18-1171, partial [uncultured Thermomicrobiales bacterium]
RGAPCPRNAVNGRPRTSATGSGVMKTAGSASPQYSTSTSSKCRC